mgnify:CR=1 FL=1
MPKYPGGDAVSMPGEIYLEDVGRILETERPWDVLSGRRILVTGATGMLGSIVTDALEAVSTKYRFDVTAMSRNPADLERMFFRHSDNPRFSVRAHDVNEPMMDADYDTIIHLASNTHPRLYQSDPIGTITTNVLGLKNLLDTVSHSEGGRFVFASSVEIYGQDRGDVERFDEGYCGYIDCNTLRAGYNESKRVGEALCQAYGHQFGTEFVIPRLSRLYGPSMRVGDSKALSQFLTKAAAGEDIVLKSKGDQLFSYCYAADAAEAVIHLLLNGRSGEAYNVSGPEDSDITLRELAEKLADIASTKVVFEIPEAAEAAGYSKASRALLDTSKIRATGWSPRYGIEEGLRRTVRALASERRRDLGRSRRGRGPPES